MVNQDDLLDQIGNLGINVTNVEAISDSFNIAPDILESTNTLPNTAFVYVRTPQPDVPDGFFSDFSVEDFPNDLAVRVVYDPATGEVVSGTVHLQHPELQDYRFEVDPSDGVAKATTLTDKPDPPIFRHTPPQLFFDGQEQEFDLEDVLTPEGLLLFRDFDEDGDSTQVADNNDDDSFGDFVDDVVGSLGGVGVVRSGGGGGGGGRDDVRGSGAVRGPASPGTPRSHSDISGRDILDGIKRAADWVLDKLGLGGGGGDGPQDANGIGKSDPLVLDLDGDGIELIDLEDSNAYFDLNGDGFSTLTSWVSADDATLAIDTNGDGVIDSIEELIGDANTPGFVEIATYDSNGDGKIDASDQVFSELLLWQDHNGDGVGQAEELTQLSDSDVASINLEYESTGDEFTTEGRVARVGSFTRVDGTEGTVADVEYAVDGTYSNYVDNYAFFSEVLVVENIKGYGTLPDLQIAMSLDEDFRDYAINLLDNANVTTLVENFTELMIRWGGFQDVTIDDLNPTGNFHFNETNNTVRFSNADEVFTPSELMVLKTYANGQNFRLDDAHWRDEAGNLLTVGGLYRESLNEITRNLLAKFAVTNGLLTAYLPSVSYSAETDLLTSDISLTDFNFNELVSALFENANNLDVVNEIALTVITLTEIHPHLLNDFNTILHNQLGEGLDGTEDLLSALNNDLFKLLDVSGSDADILYGGENSDVILGNGGKDVLWGYEGSDVLVGGDGDDRLDGGSGDDALNGGNGHDSLDGSEGDDILLGGDGRDTLEGGNGNDWLEGQVGHDDLFGGSGDDVLQGGNGDDILDGQSGVDDLYGDAGQDTLSGGQGDDFLDGGSGDDLLQGGVGNDYLDGGDGIDIVIGGDGDDLLLGYDGGDELSGDAGDDELYGEDGADILNGGRGDDVLDGGGHNDTLIGDRGNDTLNGGNGRDTLLGGENNDILNGDNGNDTLEGGSGADTLNGGNNHDSLTGDSGNDLLVGGNGNDVLDGGGQNDTLDAGNGHDTLTGGRGNDALTGGGGNDTFVYNQGDGADTITDFGAGNDLIDLSGTSVVDFNSLNISSVANDDGTEDAFIRFGPQSNGNNLTLDGVVASSLDEDDFLFG